MQAQVQAQVQHAVLAVADPPAIVRYFNPTPDLTPSEPVRSKTLASQTVQNYLTVTRPGPTRPDALERKLWAAILLVMFEDVAAGGPGSQAYREALEDLDGIEFVMGGLGYDQGAGKKLLAEALRRYQERRVAGTAGAGLGKVARA